MFSAVAASVRAANPTGFTNNAKWIALAAGVSWGAMGILARRYSAVPKKLPIVKVAPAAAPAVAIASDKKGPCSDQCACYQPTRGKPLAGSFKGPGLHLFLVVLADPNTWPKEASEIGGFAKLMNTAISARKFPAPVKFTLVYSEAEKEVPGEHTVMVYPEQARYSLSTEADVNAFLDAIAEGKSAPFPRVSLEGEYNVFVCAHNKRDARCGSCGPVLACQFEAEGRKRGIKLRSWKCSHVGGHEFAGNALIYPGIDSNGEYYGYIGSESGEVALVVENHMVKKDIMPLLDLWRGRMGVSGKEHEALVAKLRGGASA